MATTIFGIDLGRQSLKIAVVEKRLRSHEVTEIGYRDVHGMDDVETAATLLELLSQLKFDKDADHVTVVFPGEKLSSRTLFIPLTQRKQITEALPFEIEPLTPFDANDFVCDYTLIKTEGSGTRLLASIALKRDLEKFLNLFAVAGVDPEIVLPSPIATSMAIPDDFASENETVALLDIGHRSTVITLVRNGVPVAFHTTRAEGAGIAKLIAREVNRLLISEAGSEENVSVSRVVTCGGLGGEEVVLKAIGDELGCDVEIAHIVGDDLPPDDNRSPAISKLSPSIFTTAIGAAICSAGGGAFEPANLRGGDEEEKRGFAGDKKQVIVAACLLATAIFFGFASFFIEGERLDRKYEGLKRQIRAEFKMALPDVKNIVSEKQQLKNSLAKIREKSKILGAGLMAEDPFLDRLLDLSTAAPEGMKLDIDELAYEWGKVTMSGRTESFEKVEQLKKSIENLPWTGKVTVDRAKAGISSSEINFRLEVEAI